MFEGPNCAVIEVLSVGYSRTRRPNPEPINTWDVLLNRLGKTQEKPASAFIRLALNASINIKPHHETLRSTILNRALVHNHVVNRDKIADPLATLEKEYFIGLLNRIYGACVTQSVYEPTYEDLKVFTNRIFNNPELSHIRVGCIVDFLADKCQKILTFSRLAKNTIRKIIKSHSPLQASRRGRGKDADKDMLRQFVIDEFGLIPL